MEIVPLAKNGRKVCSRCKIEQSVSEFYKSAKEADGLQYVCKTCQNPRKTGRKRFAFRAENGEKRCSRCFRILSTENFHTHPECVDGFHPWCRDCHREYNRSRPNNGHACMKILKQHHEDLKHDPERLSTKFIADVVGCRCRRLEEKK